MPSKKCPRPASQAGEGDARIQGHPPSLQSYRLLPLELRHLIVKLACCTPPSPSTSSRYLLQHDCATAASLCLVCRETRELATDFLWREITITRPSSLYGLHQSLIAHPERRQLIASLHIGPQDLPPAHWWPLRQGHDSGEGKESYDMPPHWIATSLEKSCLPPDCKDRQMWRLDGSPSTCRQAAVAAALDVVEDNLGVDLTESAASRLPHIERVFEAQAALDLYLARVRTLENENEELARLARPGSRAPLQCRERCDHYPALSFVEDFRPTAYSPSASSQEVFTISRAQLLRHIARRGAVTDRLDHPLLFARSGYEIEISNPSGKRRNNDELDGARYKLRFSEEWDVDSCESHPWSSSTFLQSQGSFARVDAAVRSTATLGSILRLSRSVLDLTTTVRTLSLTGLLESVLDGFQKVPSVLRLSLGPCPSRWPAYVNLEGLEQLEQLRLCGAAVNVDILRDITRDMPKLTDLHFSMVEEYRAQLYPSIVEVIDHLVSDNVSNTHSASAGTPDAQHPLSAGSGTNDGGRSDGHNTHVLSIFAKLHPNDVSKVRDQASPETQDLLAWVRSMSWKVTTKGSQRGSHGYSTSYRIPMLWLGPRGRQKTAIAAYGLTCSRTGWRGGGGAGCDPQ